MYFYASGQNGQGRNHEFLMKHQRHATIRDLLVRAPISNQDELRRKLATRGFHVTQATLSRDIHELQLSKGPAGYAAPLAAEDEDASLPGIHDVLRTFGLEVRQAMNLLVLITSTGSAQPVAAGIDYEEWPEVLGTIAGDDTVLVICPDEKQAATLRKRIEAYIG
jgi:transcriptional regulator of arginine metabolism